MKKIIFSFILSASLAIPTFANPSWSKVSAELRGTGYTNVTNLAVYGSWSYAYVEDSLGNSADVSDGAWWPDADRSTSALAAIPAATGYAQTEYSYFHLDVDSAATPPVDVKSFSGLKDTGIAWLNGAYQEWTFLAETDGRVEFHFNLSLIINLKTDLPGEKAFGVYEVWLGLSSTSGGWDCGSIGGIPITVQDGVDYFTSEFTSLSRQLYFASGESGKLYIQVRTFGSANTLVPVPSAVLLGGIGVSLVGWLKRRRTI